MIEIAIDGTAASGKGTLGKKLSDKYSFPYLDTGILYRKVAYELLKRNKLDQTNLEQTCCDFATILTFKELISASEVTFNELDKDQDGTLSIEEQKQ